MNTGLLDTFVEIILLDESTGKLFAGTHGGVFLSTHGGETWVPINTGLLSSFVFGLATNPFTPNTVYAGTLFRGAFKMDVTGYTSPPPPAALPPLPIPDSPATIGGASGGCIVQPFTRPAWLLATSLLMLVGLFLLRRKKVS